MRRISIIAAALMLCAAPASAKKDDLMNAVLAQTVNCLHNSVRAALSEGGHPINKLIDYAAAVCEPGFLDYMRHFYPNEDLKKAHAWVIEGAGRQVDDYFREQGR
jgi:hypothetical protein